MADWLADGFHTDRAATSVQQPDEIDVTYAKLLSAAKWTGAFLSQLRIVVSNIMEAPV